MILTLAVLVLTSCSKDDQVVGQVAIDDEEEKFVPPMAKDYETLISGVIDDVRQTTTFKAEEGLSFTSEQGVQLKISANCLTMNGDIVTGDVELEYIEIFRSGKMATANKPVMGLKPNGDKALLISGGEFYINATQNGNDLVLTCPMQLIVPTELTGGSDPEMSLWKGIIDQDGEIVWEERKRGNGDLVINEQNYFAYFNEFGWTNVDRFYSDPRPKTTLKVKVPDGFDDQNANVYLYYDGEENALARLDTYNSGTGVFSEHYGQIPIGLEMHVIFVTEENGQFRYAIKGVTVAANDLYTFTMADTLVGSEADLVAAIESLP